MKKVFVAMFFAAMSLSIFAGESSQLGFWFNYPEDTRNSAVDGVKFGLPVSSGYGSVKGAELSLLCSATDYIRGVQFSLFGANVATDLDGVQLGVVNWTSRRTEGVQLGFINKSQSRGIQLGFLNISENNAPFQLGLLNMNRNGWLPFMIFVNFDRNLFD